MPVAKGPSFDARSGLIFGGVAVVVAVTIGLIAVVLGQNSNKLVLGDQDFRFSKQSMAEEIEENGPILFQALTGDRDIWLQHLSEEIDDGWVAFDARNPGVERDCNVAWQATNETFENPCDASTFPSDGEGLPQIPVFVNGGELVIDLNGIRSSEDFEPSEDS